MRDRPRPFLPFLTLLALLVAVGAAAEEVHFAAADGYRIAGRLARPAAGEIQGGVVLLHMYKSDKESWKPLTPALTARGLVALAIDLRGHGDSRWGPTGTDGWQRVLDRDPDFFGQMHLDAEAAVRFLLDQGIRPARVGLVGASVGCSVAIQTAVGGEAPVAAVVVMTPGKEYLGIPTMAHIESWKGQPLLILTSAEEKERGAGPIFRALREQGAALRVFDKEGIHGTRMFGEVDGVETLIADWLADRLQP
jgi:alpha-beta hydrolase superfamily lysophospholipase